MESGRILTEVELELMTILWRIAPATVRDVIAHLPPHRQLAYTTVSTVIRILEKKGFVSSRAVATSKAHAYAPEVSKKDYEARNLGHIVHGLFAGDAPALVRSLIENTKLDEEDLRALRALLDERLRS